MTSLVFLASSSVWFVGGGAIGYIVKSLQNTAEKVAGNSDHHLDVHVTVEHKSEDDVK